MIRIIRMGVLVAGILSVAAVPLAPRTDVKTVSLICSPGWRASAGGQYGGVGFTVDCRNGRGNARLVGTVGTAYNARVGVESESIGADCAFFGDAASASHTCVEVTLSIK